jgi:hypothetical protein
MLKRVVREWSETIACEWSVKIHFRRACLYIDLLTHVTISCSLFNDIWLVIVAFSAIRQSSLFSSRHDSLFSDRSPVIVAFSVSNLFDSHQGSLFSDISLVIVAFSVSKLFNSHQGSLFSDMSPVIIAFLVSSHFGSRQGSLFSNMSPVIIVFSVIHRWFVSQFKLTTCSYNLKLVLTDVNGFTYFKYVQDTKAASISILWPKGNFVVKNY